MPPRWRAAPSPPPRAQSQDDVVTAQHATEGRPAARERHSPARRAACPRRSRRRPRWSLPQSPSVVAATVVSRLWQAGTVWATAMTPVIVALVKEAPGAPGEAGELDRHARGRPPLARATRAVAEPPPEAYAPPPPVVGPDPGLSGDARLPARARAPAGAGSSPIATGLLACVIGVAVDDAARARGRAARWSAAPHHTTIFGGHRSTSPRHPRRPRPTEKKTTTSDKRDEHRTRSRRTPRRSRIPRRRRPTAHDDDRAHRAGHADAAVHRRPSPPPTQTQPPAQTQPPPTTP